MKRLISIIAGILVVGGLVMFFSLNGDKQMSKEASKEEEMIAIATSDEANKVYEAFIKKREPKAFTTEGVIQTYEVDLTSLDYNPMGGMMVRVIINKRQELYINYNLINNGDGTYHSAYYSVSEKLSDLLGEPGNVE